MRRRDFTKGGLAAAALLTTERGLKAAAPADASTKAEPMYGLIASLQATPGDRDRLIAILLEGTQDLPGCKLYAIAADASDEVTVWITEAWESEAAHQASLKLPAIQHAIAAGKPMIAGFGERHVVYPVGGLGL